MKTYTELTPQERNDLIYSNILGWVKDTRVHVYIIENGWRTPEGEFVKDIYDFSSDLNACHLVEEKMDEAKRGDYVFALIKAVDRFPHDTYSVIHATASQKTEAILKAYNLIS